MNGHSNIQGLDKMVDFVIIDEFTDMTEQEIITLVDLTMETIKEADK